MLRALPLAIAVVFAGAAAPAPAEPPHTVAGVTVTPPGDPPKVVESFPAAGQVVAPGALVLKITFDQKMQDEAFDIGPAAQGRAPSCLKQPRLLNDQKTFVLLCTTAAKTSYALTLNGAANGGFANVGGARAAATTLAFSTDDEDGPRSLPEALKVAHLTEHDAPIATQPQPAASAAGAP